MTDTLPPLPGLLFRGRMLLDGWTDELISSMALTDDWHQVRPGAHVTGERWTELDAGVRHRILVAATVPKLGPDTVVSHLSAARLHGLPVGRLDEPDVIHVTRNRRAGGYRKGWVHAHPGVLDSGVVTQLDGIPVTSVARTVVDAACLLPRHAAVAMTDDALHRHLTSGIDLAGVLAGGIGRRGISGARHAILLADGRSESVGESLSRLAMRDERMPTPVLQYEIRDDEGNFVARCDFGWPHLRTVGEFDGRIKYSRLIAPGDTAADVVWREKQREDRIRELGWEVVRWTWADLADPDALCRRVQRALDRGARR